MTSKYYVCIGRLAYDDEDTTNIIEAESSDAALEVLERQLRTKCACEHCQASLAGTEAPPAQNPPWDDGHDFYVNTVIECDTKPRLVISEV